MDTVWFVGGFFHWWGMYIKIGAQRLQERDPKGINMINQEFDEVIETLDSCQNKSYPEDQIEEDEYESDELEREDFEYRTNDTVRKYQFDYDMETCILPKFPEAIPETAEHQISVAPGEEIVPTNILREDNWDVKSFPSIHPSGKNGFYQ